MKYQCQIKAKAWNTEAQLCKGLDFPTQICLSIHADESVLNFPTHIMHSNIKAGEIGDLLSINTLTTQCIGDL